MKKLQKSSLQRIPTIQRAAAPVHFRNESEVHAAYEQVGYTPSRNTKSWYRDIYEFYQNNEC